MNSGAPCRSRADGRRHRADRPVLMTLMDSTGSLRHAPSRAGFRPASLDALNFLLADVRGALGPYLNVFLITQQHWSQSSVGLGHDHRRPAWPCGPDAGGRRDRRDPRANAALSSWPSPCWHQAPWSIFACSAFLAGDGRQHAIAVVGDVFGPAVAALTLGLYARAALARRMGRNAAFDHAGNVMIAAAAGAVG